VKAVSYPSKSRRHRKPSAAALMVAVAGILVTVARAGHELPVYPSYYPHEIAIETVAPERAADLLRENKLHAYLGPQPSFAGDMPASIRAVESLGSFIIVRLNPASSAARDDSSACAMIETVLRGMAGNDGFVFHPYPVTPLHGDYLDFADLAAAAKARFLPTASAQPAASNPKIKADGAQKNLVPAAWIAPGPEWDAAVEAVDAAGLLAGSMRSVNGWIGPPWLKAGWFHAERILADALDDADAKGRAEAALARLEASQERDGVERINLERELVTALAGNCRKVVAGYTVRRQYFSAEFTDGIENIGFDSIAGLDSPMFLRTVKLKDFPWNGWLRLGIDTAPQAAWNPIAGFDDPFGHLLWSAVGDPALLPRPYDSGWMLNRISDVQSSSGR
jgi:hypothetical protein